MNISIDHAVIFTADGREVLRFDDQSCTLGRQLVVSKTQHSSLSLERARIDVQPPGRMHGFYAHEVVFDPTTDRPNMYGITSTRFHVRGAVVDSSIGASLMVLASSCDWTQLQQEPFRAYLIGAPRRERSIVVAALEAALVDQRPAQLAAWMWRSYPMPLGERGYGIFDACARSAVRCGDVALTLGLFSEPPIFFEP